MNKYKIVKEYETVAVKHDEIVRSFEFNEIDVEYMDSYNEAIKRYSEKSPIFFDGKDKYVEQYSLLKMDEHGEWSNEMDPLCYDIDNHNQISSIIHELSEEFNDGFPSKYRDWEELVVGKSSIELFQETLALIKDIYSEYLKIIEASKSVPLERATIVEDYMDNVHKLWLLKEGQYSGQNDFIQDRQSFMGIMSLINKRPN